jgi:pimeloyl-ACP methyl ester carboxylesterase
MTTEFTEEFVAIGGERIHLLKGGAGEPLLLLHGVDGNRGWLRYVQALSDRYTVYAPTHPGFGDSDPFQWMESVRDVAAIYTWLMRDLKLEGVRAIGVSLGGWVAAEMAVMSHHVFSKLMLVDAVGVKPEEGEILDIFVHSQRELIAANFHDPTQVPEYEALFGDGVTREQAKDVEYNRTVAARLCWKPYMFNPTLPHLLAGVRVPTRIVWGRQDAMVPLNCGGLYQRAIPDSELAVIENCGHTPHIEKPDEFVELALEFLA